MPSTTPDQAADSAQIAATIGRRVTEFLGSPEGGWDDRVAHLRARYDAGLAWVHFPEDQGGMGISRIWQPVVDGLFGEAGAPDNSPGKNYIGIELVAPTILECGTPQQQERFLRPIWTGEEIWCQLFSEPGAGSDLASLATSATRFGDGWSVTGQKVWTSAAHLAQWAILLARHDRDLPKHAGLTFFLCDMSDPGVEVRPLRQITGEAEFNEVFLDEVHIPDEHRLGDVGEGWRVANATLMNERVAMGGGSAPRESGMVGLVARTWRENADLRTSDIQARLLRLWVEAEIFRIAGERLRQKAVSGVPGPEGSAVKVQFAGLAQALSSLEVEMLGADGLRYDDWAAAEPLVANLLGREAGFRYLRARGNSIEGGTSEILKNVIAEKVLGLPPEPRSDTRLPWKELPR